MTDKELREHLDPTDGYSAVVIDNRPVSMSIYVELLVKGRSASRQFPHVPEAQEILTAEADERQFGDVQRAQHLVDAVCRFFTTGGTEEQLVDILKRMRPVLLGPLVLPGGYFLLATYLNTENVYEHVFISHESPEAILWVEDEFIDVLSWDDAKDRLGDNGQLATVTDFERIIAAAGTRQEDTADLRQLLDRQSPEGQDAAG